MSQSQVPITLNGKPHSTASKMLSDFIHELNIATNYLAVAINNEVIPSAEYPTTPIKQDDFIELIQPVSGG